MYKVTDWNNDVYKPMQNNAVNIICSKTIKLLIKTYFSNYAVIVNVQDVT